MTEPTVLNELYLDVLTHRLGLAPRVLDAGGLMAYALGSYTCLLEHGGLADPSFMAVRLSFKAQAFGIDGTLPDATAMLAAAAHVTRRLKVVKACVDEDIVLFSCEQLVCARGVLPTAEAVLSVLPRSHDLLTAAPSEFHETLELNGIAAVSA